MTTPVDTGFSRISKESIIRNPNTSGALTGADIAYDTVSTVNEKIDSLVVGGGGNALIQFKDEGANLGSTGTVSGVDFVGAGVTASRVGNNVTVTIPGGGGGGGSGDVVGPASSTDNAIARFDTTTGKLIQNSLATIDDTGNLTATNLSGTNTGDNSVNSLYSGLVSNATHTGDVTGATALTIANSAVTNAKMANMATKTYKGRTSAATGVPEDVAVATLKTDLVLVKADVGLSLVDNTSDATKNSATATLTNKTLTIPIIASIKGTVQTDTDGATITFDKNVATYHRVVLGGNRTLAVSNMAAGDTMVIDLVQDATGTRTVTWFTTIKWVGGTVPTLTTTINKIDTFGILCTSAGNYQAYILGQNL